jgi:hypothetical protein
LLAAKLVIPLPAFESSACKPGWPVARGVEESVILASATPLILAVKVEIYTK